ncbi:MAG: ATP-binding cassette domain-containing protein [Rikenellaceae bacterium]|nr:ATP-binding cassette domain-containing protein [Rikenellaceae bacterium]
MSQNVIELKGVSIYQPHGAVTVLNSGNYRRRGELVLSDVNLSVGKGEMVYFIGRVGSGKSSLLRTLYAEMPLLEGEALVAGFDLATIKRRQIPMLRRRLGIVFQNYRLLTDRNVFDNLHFVMEATGWKREDDMRKRIDEVLTITGLQNKAYKMPYELSGGQQQKLAIARALINSPEVILADEPTGNLDPTAADEIMTLFRGIVEGGCSIVMSTHNIANIGQFPSRTVRFAGGKAEEIDIEAILAMN